MARILRCLLWICFLFACISSSATQAQSVESNAQREKIFAFEVKQIDEFIERFNDDSSSFIRQYLKTNYPDVAVDRATLVHNLFNLDNKNWNQQDTADFCSQALDTNGPVHLDFYNQDWFAEAFCHCSFKGKPAEAIILLKVNTDSAGGAKWIIYDAYCNLIPATTDADSLTLADPGNKFLNPISHATNFIGLSRALKDKAHIRDYLDSNFLSSGRSRSFLQALLDGSLRYDYVKSIRYHFLEVNGWVFTVNYFRREAANSGWLISNLMRANDQQKLTYRAELIK
jgi:hypothetical protein